MTLRRPAGVALSAAVLALAACAHLPPAGPSAGLDPEEGLASFYGRREEGRTTASGEPYDPKALTCAHRSLPFGTRLRVTDKMTGKSVVVTVNDRGPAARGRILDLSLAAARALGMVERGVARVRVERLK